MDTPDTNAGNPTNESTTTPNEPAHLPAQRTIRSEELFQGEREMFILHGTQVYRLMETKNGKLILQK